jgi:hypothetical protein
MYLHYQKDDRRTFVAATGDKTVTTIGAHAQFPYRTPSPPLADQKLGEPAQPPEW